MTERDMTCVRTQRARLTTTRMAAALALWVLTAAPAAAQPSIGPVAARAGEKVSGFIEVPAGVDSATRIPITVIQGRAPGPVLALVAGTHGLEVAPIVALQRLRALVDPAQLRGTLVLVHIANLPSFVHRTVYRNPWDQKNLNRVYPGSPDGTVTERIADLITREVIDKSDYLVDMHAGDGNEALRPFTYWNKLGLDPRVDSIARDMALAWGNDHIYIDTSRPKELAKSAYTQNTAHIKGKPAITAEAGYMGLPEEAMVVKNLESALRLMRYLKMLPGPVELLDAPVWFERTEVLTAPASGTWHAAVAMGVTVARGALLGRLTDYFGQTIAEIRAPFGGVVLYTIGSPAMSRGEPVAMVGVPVREGR